MSVESEKFDKSLVDCPFVAVVREDPALSFEVLSVASETPANVRHAEGELERAAAEARGGRRVRLVRFRVESVRALEGPHKGRTGNVAAFQRIPAAKMTFP